MDIWIIRDGEKTGPFPDYEIRSKISTRDLGPDTRAWHEGMGDWVPLSEIPLFRNEFEIQEAQDKQAAPPAVPATPPPVPSPPAFIRRFWARWLDLHIYSALWWLGLWAAGQDIGATTQNIWIMVTHFVPWFILETLLIHKFGSTPGKWLLRIRVTEADGSLLSLAAATRRSLRVLIAGIGFGWGLLTVLCQGISFYTARKLGAPVWDHLGGHRVSTRPLNAGRIISTIILLYIAIQMQAAVIAPYMMETFTEQFPKLKEHFEKNPPWQLPKRD